MPGRDPDAADGDVAPSPPTMWQRLQNAMLKPATADAGRTGPARGAKPATEGPTTVPELEAAVARADDKERLVGLLAAPLAAAIGLLVSGSLIANDPKALLSNGQINKAHVAPSLYLELGGVAVALGVLMLVLALLRKRLYLGITMALFGLTVFNLHFWGFGLPYVMVAAWLLVRSYRLQSKLKEAKAAGGGSTPGRALPNKRFTPPISPPGSSPAPKAGKDRKAG
ncbi:MAG TPA: hypothetical protein VMV06_05465 [Acidimicrobiales bacterium]|nr:hypothetical protein [Acidimicrobiales bacterium]